MNWLATKRCKIVKNFLISIPFLLGSLAHAEALQKMPATPLWGRFEVTVTNFHIYANPFADVELRARLTRPDKSLITFWGFHDGDGRGGQNGAVWKLRVMPDQPGIWSYECSFSDGTSGARGKFTCVTNGALPGPLRIDKENPHFWKFADGNHYWSRPFTAPELFVAGNVQQREYWIDYFFGRKYRFNLCNANLLNFVAVNEELNWQGTPYKAPESAHEGAYMNTKRKWSFSVYSHWTSRAV